VTPEAYKSLQQPFADLLRGLIGTPENPGAGIPSYRGPTTAPITGAEQGIVKQLANPKPQTTPASSALNQIAQSPVPGLDTSAISVPGATSSTYQPQSLSTFLDQINAARNAPTYNAQDANPLLQGAITAATRPILQDLAETLDRTLPGRFTQSGQFTQPQGSSAFDRAAALATRGATQEIGDISSNLAYQSSEAERARQFEDQQAQQENEQANIASELERQGQYGEAARQRSFTGQENYIDRLTQAREAAKQREQEAHDTAISNKISAATNLPAVSTSQVNDLITRLQGVALPRLIQQSGYDTGLQQFNDRLNSLLTTLGVTSATASPVIANKSSGSGKGASMGYAPEG
jgi:hypothetical protein